MTKNKNFKQRTLTGFIFILVLISGLIFNEILFLLTIGLVMLLCLNEYLRLAGKGRKKMPHYLGVIWGSFVFGALVAHYLEFISFKMAITLMFAPLFVIMLIGLFDREKDIIERSGILLLGVVYCAFPFALLFFTGFEKTSSEINFTPLVTLQLFVMVWSFDTFAYLGGKLLGKHKLFPSVSPNKTVEGLFFGLIFCCLSVLIFQFFLAGELEYGTSEHLIKYILLGIVVGLSVTIGDLFQSSVKRKAGVKDSGKLLPGHGGAWDRFDGLIIAAPFYYLILF
jgi:phosphatidate cytidylyltransferase